MSPENIIIALEYIKVVLGIMDSTKPGEKRVVYLAHPIKEQEVHDRNEPYRYAAAFNAQLFTAIVDNPDLGKKFRSGELILISTLVDDYSRRVHKILDPTTYI